MFRLLVAVLALLLGCRPSIVSAQGQQVPDERQTHIPNNTSAVYRAPYAPTSGQHWGTPWAEWRTYDDPIPPEACVHNLEHGGIVLLYRCNKPCPEIVAEPRDLYRTFPKAKNGKVKLVLAPDPKLRTPIAIFA